MSAFFQGNIFETVKTGLAGRLAEVLADLLPGGRICGREYVCGSSAGGPGKSCSTNLDTGTGGDFNTGERWGDIIELTARVNGLRPYDAALWLSERYNLGRRQPQKPLRSDRNARNLPSFLPCRMERRHCGTPIPAVGARSPSGNTETRTVARCITWRDLRMLTANPSCRSASAATRVEGSSGVGSICPRRARCTTWTDWPEPPPILPSFWWKAKRRPMPRAGCSRIMCA